MPPGVGPSNEDELLNRKKRRLLFSSQAEKLRDYYRAGGYKGKMMPDVDDDLPYVPRPSIFQPDVPVTGDQDFVNLAYKLMDLDPGTKEMISSITVGPTGDHLRRLMRSDLSPYELESTLLGSYTPSNHKIFIQPKMSSRYPLDETLAHEISHASGYNETGAEEAERIYREKKSR